MVAGLRRMVCKNCPNLRYCTSKNRRSVPYPQTVRPARTVRQPRVDSPVNHFQPKPTDSTNQNKVTQELVKNTTNSQLVRSSWTVRTEHADSPPGSQTAAQTRPLKGQPFLPFARSPKSTKRLLPNHRSR
jgi:hypothetical protein